MKIQRIIYLTEDEAIVFDIHGHRDKVDESVITKADEKSVTVHEYLIENKLASDVIGFGIKEKP